MADLKGVCAVLLTGAIVVTGARQAAAAAVGEGHPLLTAAAESLADRAEADVATDVPVAFVACGLDLGLGRLGGVLAKSGTQARHASAVSAVVDIASADPTFAVSTAVHGMAGTIGLLSSDARPADREWVIPASGPEQPVVTPARPIVIPDEPVMTEAKPDKVENLLVSFLAALGGIRDFMREGLHDGLEGGQP